MMTEWPAKDLRASPVSSSILRLDYVSFDYQRTRFITVIVCYDCNGSVGLPQQPVELIIL